MKLLWLTCTPDAATFAQGSVPRQIVEAHWPGPEIDSLAWRMRIDRFAREQYPLIVIEVDAFPGGRGLDLLDAIRNSGGNGAPVWIFQNRADQTEISAWVAAGADHVAVSAEEILEVTRDLAGYQPSEAGEAAGWTTGRPMIGTSQAMREVAANIRMVAGKRCNVLIEGETGTGKEVVARQIHATGDRSRGPWVAVNCGAIPDTLLEAELFGHVKGAYTGALQSRAGKFELAQRGTIFLDEIGEMPLAVQAKLLRVLQEREVERLGGSGKIQLDVRVIAATNSNLAARVREGAFRQDLYYRLNVFRIGIAPLRDRPGDIRVLASHFIGRFCTQERIGRKPIEDAAIDALQTHSWPGNVRELENVMETALILSASRSSISAADIRFDHDSSVVSDYGGQNLNTARAKGPSLSPYLPAAMTLPLEGLDYQEALNAFEHSLLTQAITRTRGNKTAAADLLRLKRTTLSARMRVLESRMPRLVA